MGDTTKVYPAHRLEQKKVKADRLKRSTALLVSKGIKFTSHNNGVHLKITPPSGNIIDFWPSTGRWVSTKRMTQGYGVGCLLDWIGRGKT